MASKFIKIFNDTVLKQTVLQGYELQRTNENLGTICMGELAYTRDTGRLFVGNFSTQELNLDTKYIGGGILTGNKYIGLIDSRPLCHFNGEGSTGCYPLNYETNTVDRDENKVFPDEIGLFLENSRYRPFNENEKTFKYGGDGWNKKPEYIQKYGVYSGDYTFDIYNNALILFDKNIKPNTGVTKTKFSNDGTTLLEKETQINTGTLVWDVENGIEYVKDINENDITNSTILRTPITNIADPDENISKYPIYGDGYVMIRILEPDGITIDYADKKFQDGEPLVNAADNNVGSYPNWTHNILSVNYPVDKIFPNFDSNNFHVSDERICLGALRKDENGQIENTYSITIPNSIEIPETGWQVYYDDQGVRHDNRIKFRPLKQFNNTDVEEENPFDEIDDNSPPDKDSCFLSITKDGQIKYKSPKAIATKTDMDQLRDEFKIRTHTIEIGEGLKLTNKDESNFNTSVLTLGIKESNWKLELKPDEFAIEQVKNGINPWFLDNNGTYNYAGNCGFYNGVLKTTNAYEWDYQYQNEYNSEGVVTGFSERSDFFNVITDKYEHNTLVSLNYLKTPYTLHTFTPDTTTTNALVKSQFIILPYIESIDSTGGEFPNCPHGSKLETPQTRYETLHEVKVEDNLEDEFIDELPEEEIEQINEDTINYDIVTEFEIKDFYAFEDIENSLLYKAKNYRVPNHASSVLLQIKHTGAVKVYTGSDYQNLNESSNCILDRTTGGCDVIELSIYDGVLMSQSKLTNVTINGEKQEIENSDWEDAITKSFQYLISTTDNFTINLLGYRV